LLVGSSFAKSMALALRLPLITVHHMQAHVLAAFIDEPKPSFPFLCLTVSGGHTQIVFVKDFLVMEVVGETLDDAAGEAFDKTARLLQLPYPGGPLIDTYAQHGNPSAFRFPEPKMPGLDFSFSGLKTSVLYFLKDQLRNDPGFISKNLPDICASVQHRIISILLNKVELAAQQFNCREIAIAGGVSANSALRSGIRKLGLQKGWNIYIPAIKYCTDNAAMIAITAYYKFLAKDFAALDAVPTARMEF